MYIILSKFSTLDENQRFEVPTMIELVWASGYGGTRCPANFPIAYKGVTLTKHKHGQLPSYLQYKTRHA